MLNKKISFYYRYHVESALFHIFLFENKNITSYGMGTGIFCVMK